MPILTLGQVMSMGTTLAGGRNDFSSSEASTWANLALEQIVVVQGGHHAPRESIAISSTTSGGNRIGLPTDFGYPIAFTLYQGSSSTATTGSRNTFTIPLRQRDSAWADAQDGQTIGGIPDAYVLYGSWLELFPSPNSAYSLQLRYGADQATLIQSTDTPQLSARFHQAWLYKTAELFHAARGDVDGEAMARNRYLNYVSTLETDPALKQHDRRSMNVRVITSRSPRRLD